MAVGDITSIRVGRNLMRQHDLRNTIPSVVVMGSNYFLSDRLISRLVREKFHVRCIVPSDRDVRRVKQTGCQMIVQASQGNFLDGFNVLCSPNGYIVHCVGEQTALDTSLGEPVGRSLDEFQSNLLNVLAIAACNKVSKYILQCSELGMIDATDTTETTSTATRPQGSEAGLETFFRIVERFVLEHGRKLGVDVIIVRTRLLWGFDQMAPVPTVDDLRTTVKWGRKNVRNPSRVTSTCHVENASEGIVQAIRHGSAGQTFRLTDGKCVQLATFVDCIFTASLGKGWCNAADPMLQRWRRAAENKRQRAEDAPASKHCRVRNAARSRTGLRLPHARFGWAALEDNMAFSDDKARKEIVYRSSTSLQHGMREIAERRHIPPFSSRTSRTESGEPLHRQQVFNIN